MSIGEHLGEYVIDFIKFFVLGFTISFFLTSFEPYSLWANYLLFAFFMGLYAYAHNQYIKHLNFRKSFFIGVTTILPAAHFFDNLREYYF